MQECDYCGCKNEEDAGRCRECGAAGFRAVTPAELPPDDPQGELVTLMTLDKLTEADLLVCRLDGAGIDAFIPDEFLMQVVGFNLNTFGYVRVQVHRKDYAKAKEILSKPAQSA